MEKEQGSCQVFYRKMKGKGRQTMQLRYDDHTITLVIRVLEECLEEEYSAEELRSKVRDMLALLIGSVNVYQRKANLDRKT